MGNCLSYNDDPEASGSPDQVQIELKAQTKKKHSQIKVLLLGPSDSGKSTILKQMRMIHNDKFTPQEIESYRQLRFAETLRNVNDLQEGEVYPEELLQPLQDLWGDLGAQKGWSRANEAALPENLEYFFGDLPRVFQRDYLPTTQDIIWCRAPTTGTAERMFKLRGKELNLVEVGGQRFARRQWVHCFHDVPAIMFVVSLNGYDQCMFENPSVNRMKDAMDTWNAICDSKYFRSTNIILLFNKDDLFSEKIKKSSIKRYFSDYEGPEGDAAAGRKYFLRTFLKLSKLSSKTPQDSVPSDIGTLPSQKREIYTHFTNATSDTALSRVLMTAVEAYWMRTSVVQRCSAISRHGYRGYNTIKNIATSRPIGDCPGSYVSGRLPTIHHLISRTMSTIPSSTLSKPTAQRVFNRVDGSDVYVSHPIDVPKEEGIDQGETKTPPIILIFGWMDAQLPHLYKYTEQYNKIYPGATQILVRTHQNYFWKGEAAKRASVLPVIKLLRDAGINEHTEAKNSGLLVHTFSNGGALGQTSLARTIAESLPLKATTPALPAQAFIYDSLPGILNLRVTALAFTAPIRSPALRSLAKLVVGAIYIVGTVWRHTIGLVLGQKEDTFTQLHRELNEPRLLPQHVPRTYIYSDIDELIPSESVEGHAKKARELIGGAIGYELVKLAKFEGSSHVAHARKDGKRYWDEVVRTWEASFK
ncbi:unnamed protein product [Rhizoctonia solani]|uniref:Uncharacterized protein n=1 Tax=Rhizoctonia solani TaxID=456999 RepID=A0A8H3C694_9AGAM|nr:unnamed protein product [Rhizoctonia solani]